MLVTLSEIVMLVRLVQPENANSPMLVTLSGIIRFARLEHQENAPSPIPVTLSPSGDTAGITMSVSVQLPMSLT